jgi:hypothetical protein
MCVRIVREHVAEPAMAEQETAGEGSGNAKVDWHRRE